MMIRSYEEMSVGLFMEVCDVIGGTDDPMERNTALVALLSGMSEDEVLDLPLNEFREMTGALSFLENEPPVRRVADTYRIGGYTLELLADMTKMTAGQYIDYAELMKRPDENLVRLLSVVLVPKGKKYNQDYDILDVQKAIREGLGICDARAITAFFLHLLKALTKATATSLRRRLKRMMRRERNPEHVRMMEEAVLLLERSGVI